MRQISDKYLTAFFCLFFSSFSQASQAQEFSASLDWSQRVELGSAVSGVVEFVAVNVGDKVKKGGSLVQLDNTVFKGQVNGYKAQLISSQEAFKEAERERDRALELYDRTVLSDHDLQVAKNNFKLAKANLEQVKAKLTASRFNLKHSTIRAPFDAVVLQRHAQPGQVIATQFRQDPLIIVAASNKMIARFYVAEDQLNQVAIGKQTKIVVAEQAFNGKIISIGLELVTGNTSLSGSSSGYPVEVEFPVEKLIRAGRTAKVEIE